MDIQRFASIFLYGLPALGALILGVYIVLIKSAKSIEEAPGILSRDNRLLLLTLAIGSIGGVLYFATKTAYPIVKGQDLGLSTPTAVGLATMFVGQLALLRFLIMASGVQLPLPWIGIALLGWAVACYLMMI